MDPRIDTPVAVPFRNEFERDRSFQFSREKTDRRDGAFPGEILVEVITREIDIGRQFNCQWEILKSVSRIDAELEVITSL